MENYSINISDLKKELIFFNYNIFHYPKNKSRGAERKKELIHFRIQTLSYYILLCYILYAIIIMNINSSDVMTLFFYIECKE